MANGPQGANNWPRIPAGANGPASPPSSHNGYGASPVLPVSGHVPIGSHHGIPVGVNQQGNLVPIRASSFGATTSASFLAGTSGNGIDLNINDERGIFIKQLKKMFEGESSHESIQDLVDEAYEQYLVESVIDS